MRLLLPLALVALCGLATASEKGGALRIFLDCEPCDDRFIRQQIPYVNYVRDRFDADVHVLVLDERSASGRRYELSFFGQGDYAGSENELAYDSPRTDTGDERRRGLLRVLELGLAPHVLRTTHGERLSIRYDGVPSAQNPATIRGISGSSRVRSRVNGAVRIDVTTSTPGARCGDRGLRKRGERGSVHRTTTTNATSPSMTVRG